MIDIRPFDSLGRFEIDWLSARHHFSFGEYHDPARMGIGKLRVWNDDTIKPGTGFDPHPHRDMEIITYVRKGAITHRDHLGNEGEVVDSKITGNTNRHHRAKARAKKFLPVTQSPGECFLDQVVRNRC